MGPKNPLFKGLQQEGGKTGGHPSHPAPKKPPALKRPMKSTENIRVIRDWRDLFTPKKTGVNCFLKIVSNWDDLCVFKWVLLLAFFGHYVEVFGTRSGSVGTSCAWHSAQSQQWRWLGFFPWVWWFFRSDSNVEHLTSYMLLEDWWCLLGAQVCFLLRMLCILFILIYCIYTCVCICVYFVERSCCRLLLWDVSKFWTFQFHMHINLPCGFPDSIKAAIWGPI